MQYLTMDVGGSGIKYALADESYALSHKGVVPTSYDSHGDFIAAIGRIYEPFRGAVAGIALSCCGELDPTSGYMFSGGALVFNAGTNLIESVEARCGVPVSLENDANCALLAEVHDGCLTDCRNAVALIIGTGVGGAILINGQINHGSHFHSGNASFTKVDLCDPASPPLAWLSGVGALLADYARAAGVPAGSLDGRAFFDHLQRGEPTAAEALDRFCSRLGQFIFNLQIILDVDAFAIGGGISAQPVFVDLLNDKVQASFDSAPVTLPRPQIRSCRYFNDANLIGALHHHLAPTV
ncbi:MAG: ROK family protein [Propionicimonas sp.]